MIENGGENLEVLGWSSPAPSAAPIDSQATSDKDNINYTSHSPMNRPTLSLALTTGHV